MLFTLIAERYERRSLGITSNLVFSEWEKIFANSMATTAAIDRIVHHCLPYLEEYDEVCCEYLGALQIAMG